MATADIVELEPLVALNAIRRVLGILGDEAPLLTASEANRAGHCYAMALRYFAEHHGKGSIVVLAHGFPRMGGVGVRYGHAWVEATWTQEVPEALRADWGTDIVTHVDCWEPRTGDYIPLPLYYAIGGIDPDHVVRWTDPVEVWRVLEETGEVGNWAPTDLLPDAPLWGNT